MTPVSHLVSALDATAAGLRQWDAATMRRAARELEAAAAGFDPEHDFVGGLRRMNAAVARAARLYGQKTGRPLFAGAMVSPAEDVEGGGDAA